MRDLIGRTLANWRAKVVLPYIEGDLLDIGCGTNLLARSGGIGVDVYQWGNVDIVVEDTSNLPFANESFDTVTIIAALNHIPNRFAVLKEANRVLRHDGKLVITMIPPGVSKLWHTIRRHGDADQSERGMSEGEVYGLTPWQVSFLLLHSGFDITIRRNFMVGLNQLTVAKKVWEAKREAEKVY